MIVTIINKTATPRSYLNGAVTLPGVVDSTSSVGSNNQFYLARDGQFLQDISDDVVQISDGVINYGGIDAIRFIESVFETIDANRTTGTINALAGTTVLRFNNCATAAVTVTGTFVGTLVFKGMNGTVTPFPIIGFPTPAGAATLTVTAPGTFTVNTGGYDGLQIESSAWTSGTATVVINASSAVNANAGTNVANQGTPNISANAWPVYETVGGVAVSATNPAPITTVDGSITGTISSNGGTVTLILPAGTSSTDIQLSGSLVGTLLFESSEDGTLFNPQVYRGTGVLNLLSTTASTFPSEWRGNSAGMTSLRVRCTAYTSGSATVTIKSSTGVGAVFLNAAIPIGGASAGNTSAVSLTAAASFTGVFEDMTNVASISVSVLMSQSGIVKTQFSQDGITVAKEIAYTPLIAGTAFPITTGPGGFNYFRVVVTNSSGSTSTLNLQTSYQATAEEVTRLELGSSTYLTDSLLVPINKSITAGKNPDGVYLDNRIQGNSVSNATTTPLTASGIYRGTWFAWQDSYIALLSSLIADVSGTIYIDFSEQLNPVNGNDTSITSSLSFPYDPSINPLFKRKTPIQSKWVRHRYINGGAAQSTFTLDSAFVTTDPGLVQQSLFRLPLPTTEAGIVRSVVSTTNFAGTAYNEWPVDISSVPKVSVSAFSAELAEEAYDTNIVKQLTVGTVATRIDTDSTADRKFIMMTNEGSGRVAVGTSSAVTFDTGYRIGVGRSRGFPAKNTTQWWGIAETTAGTQSTLQRSPGGTSSTGSPTTPANVVSNNATYAIFTAAGQTITGTTYTAGTTNPLVAVRLGIDGNKQASQTETVTFQSSNTGTAGNIGSVITSASVTGTVGHFYVIAISRESVNALVTGITGLNLTWTQLATQANGANRVVDVWYAMGVTGITTGTVTAAFSNNAINSHISVTRYSNVDTTTPIQAFATATGNSTIPATAGISGTNKGMAYLAAAIDNNSLAAGATYTLTSTETTAAGSDRDGLGVERKALTSTGINVPTSTASGSVQWAAISLTMTPIAAINPVITLSYTLSAVPGATSGPVTLSSSSDTLSTIDITADRSWVVADIPNINIIATATTLSAAQANIDWIYLELVDSTGNTARLSIYQGGT